MNDPRVARDILVEGIVQGVGFRPFVYQIARRLHLFGEVANTANGVAIRLEGADEAIQEFLRHLKKDPPPLSHITDISIFPGTLSGSTAFEIVSSRTGAHKSTLISPDVAVCDACLEELFSPGDRRFRYPFINCTHCGPRYTIIDDIPYDRPKTSMRHFVMCPECQAEYDDPADRRFHAQPNACPACGPRVFLHDAGGECIEAKDPIQKTVDLLKQGHIVAVKGLGGFHLAVDAVQSDAVVRLRERKHREEKPLALMAGNLKTIQTFARISPEAALLLKSAQRPIVLLKKKHPNPLSDAVSPKNAYFGVMLPYTPLHHLLLQTGFTALVMTSGNLSEEPIAIDNREAFERLGKIADYFLVHDRDIYLRSDDSIVRHASNATRIMRRSRGFVPRPVFLKSDMPRILACGAELKATICLTKGRQAFLSQHIGDLENLATYDFMKKTVSHMERILDIHPEVVAHDLHPDYLSTRYALEERLAEKRVGVQHHHAHIAGCMAENRVEGPVIGLAFDGTGFGTDDTIWGGEVLLVDGATFQRAAHLSTVPMPGGAAAIHEPWRMAASYLLDAFGKDFDWDAIPAFGKIHKGDLQVLIRMVEARINAPLTSSLGRLFDGVAAILGVKSRVRYEGQAAMELEMAAADDVREIYPLEWPSDDPISIPTAPIIRGVVEDLKKGQPVDRISGKFHSTVVELFSCICDTIAQKTRTRQIALSGGVFQNAILLKGFIASLNRRGYDVYSHTQVPTNDGGICLGQAVVAANLLS